MLLSSAAAARSQPPAEPPPPPIPRAQPGEEQLRRYGRSALLAALQRCCSCSEAALLQAPLGGPLLKLLDLERRCCFQW